MPAAGEIGLTDDEAAERAHDYLATELADRLAQGPASFDVDVQLAAGDDPIDDPTVVWPDDRETITLGRLDVTALAHDRDVDGDVLVFDPTRVPDGIVLSDDAILRARPGAYSVSVARRTSALPARLDLGEQGAHGFGHCHAGHLDRFGALRRAAEHERAFEDGDEEDRELARFFRRDARVDESRGRAGDPALEDFGGRHAQRLTRAGDLERDRRDRARVGVVRSRAAPRPRPRRSR